jgi:hypothetical protein
MMTNDVEDCDALIAELENLRECSIDGAGGLRQRRVQQHKHLRR